MSQQANGNDHLGAFTAFPRKVVSEGRHQTINKPQKCLLSQPPFRTFADTVN